MRSLTEYVYADYPTKMSTRIQETLDNIKEYFGQEIPDNLVDHVKEGTFPDYVLENLNTHDVDLLIKKLKSTYPDIKIDKAEQGVRLKKGGIIVYNHYEEDEFYDLIEFYGYDVTLSDSRKAYVNPVKADRADELVYKKNHGQLYHFTTTDKVESILKNGLRIKEGTYRYFPHRIYLYTTIKNIMEVEDIEKFMKEVTGEDNIENIAILKVNLHNHKIPMYHDEIMKEGAVYCYNNIPSSFIKQVTKQ